MKKKPQGSRPGGARPGAAAKGGGGGRTPSRAGEARGSARGGSRPPARDSRSERKSRPAGPEPKTDKARQNLEAAERRRAARGGSPSVPGAGPRGAGEPGRGKPPREAPPRPRPEPRRDIESAPGPVRGRPAESAPASRRSEEIPTSDLIWGKRTVLEHLRRESPIQRVYVTPDGAGMGREFFELAKERSIPVVRSDRERLDALTRRGNHQGIVATLGERSFAAWPEVMSKALSGDTAALLLALDGVQDPGNFGAILRTAEGAGVQGVVVSAAGSCPLSATVSKTSAGADAHVAVARVEKLDRVLQQLADEGLQVVITEPNAPDPYWAVDWTKPSVLVLGAEGEGVSRMVARSSPLKVSIPMLGQLESLNVSASAAAILYEIVRQRQQM